MYRTARIASIEVARDNRANPRVPSLVLGTGTVLSLGELGHMGRWPGQGEVGYFCFFEYTYGEHYVYKCF